MHFWYCRSNFWKMHFYTLLELPQPLQTCLEWLYQVWSSKYQNWKSWHFWFLGYQKFLVSSYHLTYWNIYWRNGWCLYLHYSCWVIRLTKHYTMLGWKCDFMAVGDIMHFCFPSLVVDVVWGDILSCVLFVWLYKFGYVRFRYRGEYAAIHCWAENVIYGL